MEQTAYIGLGANLGDRLATLQAAVDRLTALGHVVAVSPVYATEPVGYADQPAFLNAVACARTALAPAAIVRVLLEIEADLGRVRTFPNAPRVIDLDLLLLGDTVSGAPAARVPHPRLNERRFVLAPLAALAPELRPPGSNSTVAALLAALPGSPAVTITPLQLHVPGA